MKAFIIVIGFLLSQFAHAETIPATQTTTAKTTVYRYVWGGSQSPSTYSTLAAAASAAASASVSCTTMLGWDGCNYSGSVGLCANMSASLSTGNMLCRPSARIPDGAAMTTGIGAAYGQGYSLASELGCTSPAVASGSNCVTTTCPSGGYTLSGTQCSRPDCSAGQTRDENGNCVVSCPAAGSSAMVGGAQAWKLPGSSSGCTSGFVFGGCNVTCKSGSSSGGTAACTACSFTGTPGTGTEGVPISLEQKENPTTPEGCLASGKGYVTSSTGTTTCISGTESPGTQPVQTTEKTKTTTTAPGGGTSTEESTTTTECSGGNCTKTTTTTDGDGTTTKTEDKPASSFCQENPNSPMCKEQKDECEKHPERIGCAEFGTPSATEEVEEKPIGVSNITPVSLGAGASCPADIQLPNQQVFSWAPACQFADGLRPVILVLAWLAAGFIVLGFGARDNG